MKTYIISYDLLGPETRGDYVRLIEHIKSYTYWAKPLKSVWFIKTSKSVSEVRTDMKIFLDTNDKLVILDVTNTNWATYNIVTNVGDWMKKNI